MHAGGVLVWTFCFLDRARTILNRSLRSVSLMRRRTSSIKSFSFSRTLLPRECSSVKCFVQCFEFVEVFALTDVRDA